MLYRERDRHTDGTGRTYNANGECPFTGVYLDPVYLESKQWDVDGVLRFIREHMRVDHVFFRAYAYNVGGDVKRMLHFVPQAAYYDRTSIIP